MAFLSSTPGRWFGGGTHLGVVCILLAVASCGLIPCPTLAQNVPSSQAQITASGSRVSEGFFEYSRTSWTLIGPRGFVRFGSPSPTVSPFASFGDPDTGLGMGVRAGGIQSQFFGQWSQGYRRSFTGQALRITLPDGSWGTVADQAYTPFVIGFFPVVGDYAGYSAIGPGLPVLAAPFPPLVTPGILPPPAGISEKAVAAPKPREKNSTPHENEAQSQAGPPDQISSLQDKNGLVLSGKDAKSSSTQASSGEVSASAERVVYGVDEARRRREQELARENEIAQSYLSRAETALQSGKPEIAKTYLRLAQQHASGSLRDHILNKLQALEQTGKQ
ncbi:hypothetical protein [Thermogutta sp.]|uniref:hypothetical protein n=1 Tax=Thermogutta sp. TaxID=1962930 RepID=UPI003C7B5F71